jgi:hypothetical protein
MPKAAGLPSDLDLLQGEAWLEWVAIAPLELSGAAWLPLPAFKSRAGACQRPQAG